MTDTTHEAPERIWAFSPVAFDNCSIWQGWPSPTDDTVEYVRADRIEELEAKLEKAVEALRFYAEANNYEDQHKPESCGCCYYLHDAEIKEDEGAKARTTLAELKGGKDE